MILNFMGRMLPGIRVCESGADSQCVGLNVDAKEGGNILWLTLSISEAETLRDDLSAWIATKAPVAP